MQPTMTAQAAEERVEANLGAAASVLPDQAQLELFDSGQPNCDDPTDHGPKGRVIPFVTYQVLGLSASIYGRCFDLLLRWWEDNGFVVLRDSRPGGMYVWVENREDGFRMTAQANDLGQLYLTSTAPCVWPNGVPEPTS
jgi:hypothetical protein